MRTERVFLGILLLGLIFYFLKWEGKGVLLLFSLGGLGFMYFPGGLYFFFQGSYSKQNPVLSFFGGMMLSMAPIGLLFRLLHWVGYLPMLAGGVFFSLVALGLSVALRQSGKDELQAYYLHMIRRSGFWFGLCLLVFLWQTRF